MCKYFGVCLCTLKNHIQMNQNACRGEGGIEGTGNGRVWLRLRQNGQWNEAKIDNWKPKSGRENKGSGVKRYLLKGIGERREWRLGVACWKKRGKVAKKGHERSVGGLGKGEGREVRRSLLKIIVSPKVLFYFYVILFFSVILFLVSSALHSLLL